MEPLEFYLGPKDPQLLASRLLFERLHNHIVAALLDDQATLKVLRVTPKPGRDNCMIMVRIRASICRRIDHNAVAECVPGAVDFLVRRAGRGIF